MNDSSSSSCLHASWYRGKFDAKDLSLMPLAFSDGFQEGYKYVFILILVDSSLHLPFHCSFILLQKMWYLHFSLLNLSSAVRVKQRISLNMYNLLHKQLLSNIFCVDNCLRYLYFTVQSWMHVTNISYIEYWSKIIFVQIFDPMECNLLAFIEGQRASSLQKTLENVKHS